MRALIAIVILGCSIGCSTTQSSAGRKMLRYPDRSLADWQPGKAVAEAEHDIAAGTPKVYISGGIVAFAPGISAEQYSIVRTLPNADAGIGCVIEDTELRKAQFEYARRYNEYVVLHLRKR
jgi:hypothetical protein